MPDASPHLLVAISPHGYGHGAMTAPLVAELRRLRPDLRITLQTALPAEWLATRFAQPFELVAEIPDFGACMAGPLAVDVAATAARYAALHARFDDHVAAEAARQRALGVDVVLSNVSHVVLAAAARAGIAAIGYSCLTWSEIYGHVCGDRPEAAAIMAQMQAAYAGAALFLRPQPATPMAGLANLRDIGPVARRIPSRRAELARRFGLGEGERIGLIGFGGMDLPLPFAEWARLPGWRWLAPEPVPGRPDMPCWSEAGLAFSELTASVDVVVTKPGYGTFSECAVNGVPVLYLPRAGWFESAYLMQWLHRHARAAEVAREDLFGPRLAAQLQALFQIPHKPLPVPTGTMDAAAAVLDVLDAALRRQV